MSNLEEDLLSGTSSLSFLSKPRLVTRSNSTKSKVDVEVPKAVPNERNSKPTSNKPLIPPALYRFHLLVLILGLQVVNRTILRIVHIVPKFRMIVIHQSRIIRLLLQRTRRRRRRVQ